MMDSENGEKKMDEFEVALSRAMARVDAPETLVTFLTAATEVKRESVLPWRQRKHKFAFLLPRPQMFMGGALAAALVVGAFVGERVHEDRKRAAAEAQFDAAMRVTDRALEETRAQLERAGLKLQ